MRVTVSIITSVIFVSSISNAHAHDFSLELRGSAVAFAARAFDPAEGRRADELRHSGQRLRIAGIITTGVGGALAITSLIFLIDSARTSHLLAGSDAGDAEKGLGILFGIGALAGGITGGALWVVGDHRIDEAQRGRTVAASYSWHF